MSKKILLFGGQGFIGRNLANVFMNNRRFSINSPTSTQCNLLKISPVERLIDRYRPDFIINAAFIGVNSGIKYTDDYLFNNTRIVSNIIHAAARFQRHKKIIHFGSGLEYGSSPTPLTEKSPLHPLNTYATVKTITSYLATDLARSLGVPLIIIRPFNLYGPYDAKSVIYYVIKSILKKEPFTLTRGKQVRDYMFSEDMSNIVKNMILEADHIPSGQVYNIASGEPRKLKDIFKTLFRLLSYKGEVIYKDYPANDYWSQIGNSRRLYSLIDRPNFTSLEEGLKRTIEWVKTAI